jgi:hypothetical protein
VIFVMGMRNAVRTADNPDGYDAADDGETSGFIRGIKVISGSDNDGCRLNRDGRD